jgi:hypothetical protein
VFVGAWFLFDHGIQWGGGQSSVPTPETQTVIIQQKPTGADAVHPAMRDFVKQAARENGISEEEARQAIRKGHIQGGYSKEEVERIYGK